MKIQPSVDGATLKKRDWWHDLTSGEMLQASLHLSPAKVHDALETSRDVGKGLGNAWDDIKQQVGKVIHLPTLDSIISAPQRQHIADVALTAASGVGYAAAGIQAFAGIAKLTDGVQEKSPLKRLEGWLDIATAAAIVTTIGSMGLAPLILGPLAAGLGVVRGAAHAIIGHRQDDPRHEVQGLLDGTRSAAVLGSLLGTHSALAATVGAVLGPVAGAIQVSRGFIDLRSGLKEQDYNKELQGLSDIGAAVGLTMAATGIGIIPGVILTGVSVGARVLYQVSPKFAKRADATLTRCEPGLQKAVSRVEKVTDPVVDFLRPLIDKIIGAHHPPSGDGGK